MRPEPPSYTCHLRVPAWLVPELFRRAQRCRVLPDEYVKDLVITALAVSNSAAPANNKAGHTKAR